MNPPRKFSPFLLAAGAGLLVLLLAFVPVLWSLLHPAARLADPVAVEAARRTPDLTPATMPATTASEGGPLPWQIRLLPDGHSEVFGLRPGLDTLADITRRLEAAAARGEPVTLQLGLVARLGEIGTLEALAEPWQAGFVQGRLVLGFALPEAVRRRWRETSATGAGPGTAALDESSPMDGGARRFTLNAAARVEAATARLQSLTFVPATRLGEADMQARFGPPTSVSDAADGTRTLLYPARGLAISVRAGSRPVLVYVAPREAALLMRQGSGSEAVTTDDAAGSLRSTPSGAASHPG
ncbi:hypothetical protein [Pseudaquabacterium rugosum]|uniref:Uncharacterized protein n=1 Tax=Pseudaquabacterium rugosum TaxID=2984194 RepID=A0ABU9BAE4_9BURK